MRRLSLLVSLLVVGGCTDATSPTPRSAVQARPRVAQVSIVSDNEQIPWVQTVANTCTAENVQVTGTLHLRTQTVTLPNGEINDIFHTNFSNTVGVGLTSGMTYRATSAENAEFEGVPPGPPGGPWRSSHEGSLHLITTGGGAQNFFLHFVFVVTKDPGSPPNAIVFKMDITCTG